MSVSFSLATSEQWSFAVDYKCYGLPVTEEFREFLQEKPEPVE